MFVGRTRELEALRGLYARDDLRMAVVYGRRRVGKTRLLSEFTKDKPTIFFTAQQKSDVLNLRAFSRQLYAFFGIPDVTPGFATWGDALSFLAQRADERRDPLVFVFDEFPYAAEANPSLPSTFQIALDHELRGKNLLLVLCGSNEGFMEGEVLGKKSPLFGRRNAQIRLMPLGFADAAELLPGKTPEELIEYYATFGGTPYYLEQVEPDQSYEQNVTRLFFDMAGTLYAEPELLLRQETREPALYSSVLDAVGSGATSPKSIAERSGLAEGSVGRYLKSLEGLGLIERIVPFGENPRNSRKGMHRIRDPFFAYWYRFVSPSVGAIESGLGAAVARQAFSGGALATYVGGQFEHVCMQWLIRQARAGRLPFVPTSFGRWWGTDPVAREQVDIDLVLGNNSEGRAIFGECKWRNEFNESQAVQTLRHRSGLVAGYPQRSFALFSKYEVGDTTRAKAREEGDLMLVSARQLFEG